MHNTIVKYKFKTENLNEAIELWKSGVYDKVKNQKGFIRVQLYSNEDGTCIAIGSWENKEDAQNFMKTGVFKDILKSFGDFLIEKPELKEYDLKYFADNK